MTNHKSFYHIIATSVVLFFVILLFGMTNIDLAVQDYFYNYQHHQWILDANLQPYKFLFYNGIKKLLIGFALICLMILIFFWKNRLIKPYKKGLLIVVFSAILIPAIVGELKKSTNMPCPKNEVHFGGPMPKTAVWENYSLEYATKPQIACWPAGHASGGFALLSLFFLFRSQKNKIKAITLALVLGWSMGIYKMIIGDHFLSHTIITMLLAWIIVNLVNLFLSRLFDTTLEHNKD